MRVTFNQGATDSAAQQHVEGRGIIIAAMDFGTDQGSQIMIFDEGGKVTCLVDADDYYAAEKRRQDLLISRAYRVAPWRVLEALLAGGSRHGR